MLDINAYMQIIFVKLQIGILYLEKHKKNEEKNIEIFIWKIHPYDKHEQPNKSKTLNID